MFRRTFAFALIVAAIWSAEIYFTAIMQPQVASQAAIAAFNGGEAEASQLRATRQIFSSFDLDLLAFALTVAAAVVCYRDWAVRQWQSIGREENHHA